MGFMHMIRNKTRKTVICRKKEIFSSILAKAKGLMFSAQIKDTGYIFPFSTPRRIDLHMFFVFFPIDLLFLDEHKKVIEIKEGFMPFTLYCSKKKANYLIELPAGIIKESATRIGDELFF
jgi:uncharacterized membrane protein (UPF0127 family)